MALYGYNISTTSNVIYSVCGFCGVPNKMGKVMTLMGSILLRGFIGSLSCFLSQPNFLKADGKSNSTWLPLSMRVLVASYLSMWPITTIASMCGNEARLTSWSVNVMGIWDHLIWVIGPLTVT
jgi:hypothetical protein